MWARLKIIFTALREAFRPCADCAREGAECYLCWERRQW
jgi:hypothetical protein